MKNAEGATMRVSVTGALVCAGLGLAFLTGCTPPEGRETAESNVVVEPHEARQSLEGVLVSEGNPLSLYTSEGARSESARPSPSDTADSGAHSGGFMRDRAVSELGLDANVDPKICEPVRDAAVSYLAVPAMSADSFKAVSEDNLTAVTVELVDSGQ